MIREKGLRYCLVHAAVVAESFVEYLESICTYFGLALGSFGALHARQLGRAAYLRGEAWGFTRGLRVWCWKGIGLEHKQATHC
jgi:hypothetical protein